MEQPKIELWQGLARYAQKDLSKPVSLEGKALGEVAEEFAISTIEDWKIKKIPQFTLKLPGTVDKMAMCRRTEDVSGLQKVAEICREPKNTKIRFYKICEDFSELSCDGTPIGYLAITNKKGDTANYTFALEPVPMMKKPEGVIAFVDGSSGDEGNTVSEDGVTYKLYGGAYRLYQPGESEPFCKSIEDEKDPIGNGLKGISESQGNVYGEINSAMMAIRKAESLGYRHLRLYYDCEQIGGHAPGGAFGNQNTTISKNYAKFWKEEVEKFVHLRTIELVHVDAHGKPEFKQNHDVDENAKAVSKEVKEEFETDPDKRALYLANAKAYKN